MVNNLNFLKVEVIFNSSFKISLTEKYQKHEDFLKIFKKKNKQILCKNFIFLIFGLKLTFLFNDFTFFVFPKEKKSQHSVLRPPYKNKMSRHPMGFSTWRIKISFKYFFKNHQILNFNNFNSWFNYCNKLSNYGYFFETNVANQRRLKVSSKFKLNDNFLLKNFF